MSGPITSSAISAFVGASIAFGAVWLTSQLATKRSYRERLWDRKAEAFCIILEALYDFSSWYDVHLEDEFKHREVDEKTQDKRGRAYRAAKDKLYRTLAREEWLLPESVAERFKELEKALNAHHTDWLEMLEDGYRAVAQARKDLLGLARRELGRP